MQFPCHRTRGRESYVHKHLHRGQTCLQGRSLPHDGAASAKHVHETRGGWIVGAQDIAGLISSLGTSRRQNITLSEEENV